MTGAQSAVIVLCRYVTNVPIRFMAENEDIFDYYKRLRNMHVEFEDIMDAFIENGDVNSCQQSLIL